MEIKIFGQPLTIFQYNQNESKFQDNSDDLRKLFLHEKVRDRKVVVFSVTGSFRKGKSFFLDYCLRYLYSNYESLNRGKVFKKSSEWMGDKNDDLNGFSWRSGAARDTTGIIFWSDVFLCTNQSNEKFAIFVVDTQGLFDNETTLMENSKIFALSTLISSTQVINLNGNIREDELDYFQFAMEFAKLAQSDDNKSKAFQELLFLVRDWQNEDDYEFGSIGGKEYLQNVLELKNEKKQELNSVRLFLFESYERISCHLLPHPGKNVAGKKMYAGQWSLMDEDFRDELFKTIEFLLSPDSLMVKKIGGRQMNAENFYVHLKNYFKYFASDDLPKVTTIYQSFVEKDLDYLIRKYFSVFKQTIVNAEDKIADENDIQEYFEIGKDLALFGFKNERKLGGDERVKKAESKLNEKIEEDFQKWKDVQIKFLNKRNVILKLKQGNEQLTKSFENQRDEIKDKNNEIDELKQDLILVKKKFEIKFKEQNDTNEQLKRCLPTYSASQTSNYSNFTPQAFPSGYISVVDVGYPSSSASSRSSSSRPANPYNSFQQGYSSVWNNMSASEKRSAGGSFQKACSTVYNAQKGKK